MEVRAPHNELDIFRMLAFEEPADPSVTIVRGQLEVVITPFSEVARYWLSCEPFGSIVEPIRTAYRTLDEARSGLYLQDHFNMQSPEKDDENDKQGPLCDTRLVVYRGSLARQSILPYDTLLVKDLSEIDKLLNGGAPKLADAIQVNAAQASAEFKAAKAIAAQAKAAEAKRYGALSSPGPGAVSMLKEAILQACEPDHSPVPKSRVVTAVHDLEVWTQPIIEHDGWIRVCSKNNRKEEKRQEQRQEETWKGKNVHAARMAKGIREQVTV